MSKRFKYEYKNLSYTIFSAFFEHFLILLIPKPENNMMAMQMYDSDTGCMKVERIVTRLALSIAQIVVQVTLTRKRRRVIYIKEILGFACPTVMCDNQQMII